MSDTPRTDAVSVECSGHEYRECVDTNFARELEREADHYRRTWEEAMDVIKRWHDRLP